MPGTVLDTGDIATLRALSKKSRGWRKGQKINTIK